MSSVRSVLVAMVTAAATVSSQPSSELFTVLDRAAAVVADLEQRAPVLVVEERYQQVAETNRSLGGTTVGVTGGAGTAMVEGDTVRRKVVSRSELLLIRLPGSPPTWSAARSPLEVDGKPTGSPAGRFEPLVADPGALQKQWRSLTEASRKIHVGAMDRDLFPPLTALGLLRPEQRERVQFRKDGEERLRGTRTWKVAFVEQRGPTLMRTRGQQQILARGALWIDPESGRVLRTRIEIGDWPDARAVTRRRRLRARCGYRPRAPNGAS